METVQMKKRKGGRPPKKLKAISGASLAIIGKSLGHKSEHATRVYARLNLDPIRASIEKATEAMMQCA